jgi:hypothetical protein
VVKRNGLDAQACGGVEELFRASAKSLLDLVNRCLRFAVWAFVFGVNRREGWGRVRASGGAGTPGVRRAQRQRRCPGPVRDTLLGGAGPPLTSMPLCPVRG